MNTHTPFFASCAHANLNHEACKEIIKEVTIFKNIINSYYLIEKKVINEIEHSVESVITSKKLNKESNFEGLIKDLTCALDSISKKYPGFADACREFLCHIKKILKNSADAKESLFNIVFGPRR